MWRNHEQLAARLIRQGVNFIAAANSKRAPSLQEKGNVGAQAGRDFQQARRVDAFSSQPKKTYKRRGRVARSAAQAAAHGNAFVKDGAHAVLKFNLAGKFFEGSIDEVVPARLTGELGVSGNAQIDARLSSSFKR